MSNTAREILKRLSINIKRHRKAAGLTQIALALRAGLGEDYLPHIEQRKNFPSIVALCQLADALGIDAQEFFKPVDEASKN